MQRWLIVFLWALCGAVFGQDPEFLANVQHFGVKEGLCHRQTYCMLHSANGFIWIGTKNGLSRFDGYSFVNYSLENAGLGQKEVHSIIEDDDGWLWLFSYSPSYYNHNARNLSFVHSVTGEIKSVEERFGANSSIQVSKIWNAISGPDRTIFLGTKAGEVLVYKQQEFETYRIPEATDLTLCFIDYQGALVAKYPLDDFDNYQYIEIDSTGKTEKKQKGQSLNLLPGKKNGQWAYELRPLENTPIRVYRNRNDTLIIWDSLLNLPNKAGWKRRDWFCDITRDQQTGLFWYKDQSQFFVFHPTSAIVYDFEKEFSTISGNNIFAIDFDDFGAAWVLTENGCYRVSLKEKIFKTYLHARSAGFNDAISCRGIFRFDNKLRVQTQDSGVFIIDLPSSKLNRVPGIHFGAEDGTIEEVSTFYPVIETSDRQLMAGAQFLVKLNVQDGSNEIIHFPNHELNDVWSLYQDSRGRTWVGTDEGVLAYYEEGYKELRVFKLWNGFEMSADGIIYSFLELDNGNLLIASTEGLFVLDPDAGISHRYWAGGSGAFKLPFDLIYHIHQDQSGLLWLATGGGGLVTLKMGLDDDQIAYKQYTTGDGLTNNTLYAIYEDEKENLWLPSDYGLIRFNKETLMSTTFLESDGISHHEFNRASHHQSADGTLYFGGLNGLTTFHPNKVKNNQSVSAPLIVTQFTQYDHKTDEIIDRTSEVSLERQITLRPGDAFFTINFALANFQPSGNTRYSYLIDGQSKDWNTIETNSLRISGLGYGQYLLRIKGQGANGQFSDRELSLPIKVLKPIHLQSWFITLCLCALTTLLFLLYKMRIKQLKRQRHKLEVMVHERTTTIEEQADELRDLDQAKSRFFANISHELRTPLTLILAPLNSVLSKGSLSEKDNQMLQLAQSNSRHMLTLVNEILDLTKLESSQLVTNETIVALYPLTQRIVSSFTSHAQHSEIVLEFEFLADEYLHISLDTDKYEKILNNLLSNAIKFTPAGGKVRVALKDHLKQIIINVSDSGRGISEEDLPKVFDRYFQSFQPGAPAEGGTGIGLALSRELAHVMCGNLSVESILGSGSTFKLTLPKIEVMKTIEPQLETIDEMPNVTTQVEPEGDINSRDHAERQGILLVEDNRSLSDYIDLILQDRFVLHRARHGKEALGLLEQMNHGPDLIISDIMMPEMDGYQLLTCLKTHEKYRAIPVVMLTARAGLESRLKALRIGVDDYMLKPFDDEELIARVENLLNNVANRSPQETIVCEDEPEEEHLSDEDLAWLEKVETFAKAELANFNFTVDWLVDHLAMSRRMFERKLKALTGLTPHKYLLEIRLAQARYLLESGQEKSVKATALSVGLKDITNFSRHFKDRFGNLPSSYLQKRKYPTRLTQTP